MTKNTIICAISLFVSAIFTTGAVAQEASSEAPPALVKSATGFDMPQSQVSSDITVITAEEISHLPVHDVSEVLNYVTGIDMQKGGGPGMFVTPLLQGSDPRHVKILIDDIPLEFLSEGGADPSTLPIENIERVEIMKGSASSVWGSSLGGVINIITRDPSEKTQVEGGVSLGENSTRRYNAGLSGKVKDTGYFVSASRFETDGFFDNSEARIGNFYGKLTRELGAGLKAEASYGYTDERRGWGGMPMADETKEHRSRLLLTYSPTSEVELSVSVYHRVFDSEFFDPLFSISYGSDKESMTGGLIKSVWRHSKDGAFAVGVDISHDEANQTATTLVGGDFDGSVEKRAVFANETYGLGNLTVNLGARYDNDSVFGSELSPSAGAVYKLAHDTFLRVNAARGFSPPPLFWPYASQVGTPNKDLHAERAWTYQAGVESGLIPYLHSNIRLYRADITDGLDQVFDNAGSLQYVRNIGKKRRQGVELEFKTKEYKGLSLSYDYAFNDVRNMDTDEIMDNYARETHDVGVDYRGPFETRATVAGHYVWWHASDNKRAKDQSFVWDARLSKYLAKWKYAIGELYASVHNITNEDQYWAQRYRNPGRWVEAGISLSTF